MVTTEKPGIEHVYGIPDSDSAPLLAIVLRGINRYVPDGVSFKTNPKSQIQVGTVKRPPGYVVPPHQHPHKTRYISGTPEVLLILRGSCRADIYHPIDEPVVPCPKLEINQPPRTPVASVELVAGDAIILLYGGHGFACGPDGVEMFEVRQGPYVGWTSDKIRFGESK